MSADLLRRAAALMRERAEAATSGPWETYENMHAEVLVSEVGRRGFGVISSPAMGRADYGKANAEFIASWHPVVALAVADWLEAVAERHEPVMHPSVGVLCCLTCNLDLEGAEPEEQACEDWLAALTVARAYLGSDA